MCFQWWQTISCRLCLCSTSRGTWLWMSVLCCCVFSVSSTFKSIVTILILPGRCPPTICLAQISLIFSQHQCFLTVLVMLFIYTHYRSDWGQYDFFYKKCIILFSKDTLNWWIVTRTRFTMLQKISIFCKKIIIIKHGNNKAIKNGFQH